MDHLFAQIPAFANVPVIRSSTFGASLDRYQAPKILSIARAAADLRIEGDWVEFGVYRGTTARAMLDLMPFDAALHLFDSFEGLAEDWSGQFPKGSFALETVEIPDFADARVRLNQSWFSDVPKEYFSDTCAIAAFVHIDCDLYSATVDALALVTPAVRPGTIILFDEYVHDLGDGPIFDEHRAFVEWIQRTGYGFHYLWRSEWTQVAVEIR